MVFAIQCAWFVAFASVASAAVPSAVDCHCCYCDWLELLLDRLQLLLRPASAVIVTSLLL